VVYHYDESNNIVITHIICSHVTPVASDTAVRGTEAYMSQSVQPCSDISGRQVESFFSEVFTADSSMTLQPKLNEDSEFTDLLNEVLSACPIVTEAGSFADVINSYQQQSDDIAFIEDQQQAAEATVSGTATGVSVDKDRQPAAEAAVSEDRPSATTPTRSRSPDSILGRELEDVENSPCSGKRGAPAWFRGKKIFPAFASHIFYPSPPKKAKADNIPLAQLFPACISSKKWRELHRQKKAGQRKSSKKVCIFFCVL